jgi:hypothetical protein
MYENVDLGGLGTHHDHHQARLAAGDVAPLVVNGVDLDATTTVTGTPLGFAARPGSSWERVRWADYLRRYPDFRSDRRFPPGHRWFPAGSWPLAVQPPPEGSLDGASLQALLDVVASHSPRGLDTECFAFYASLPAGDFDTVHLWTGPLGHVPDLLSERGGPYGFSPTNFWPADREWFVLTDCDLQATKVSGDAALIAALRAHPSLECAEWSVASNG